MSSGASGMITSVTGNSGFGRHSNVLLPAVPSSSAFRNVLEPARLIVSFPDSTLRRRRRRRLRHHPDANRTSTTTVAPTAIPAIAVPNGLWGLTEDEGAAVMVAEVTNMVDFDVTLDAGNNTTESSVGFPKPLSDAVAGDVCIYAVRELCLVISEVRHVSVMTGSAAVRVVVMRPPVQAEYRTTRSRDSRLKLPLG